VQIFNQYYNGGGRKKQGQKYVYRRISKAFRVLYDQYYEFRDVEKVDLKVPDVACSVVIVMILVSPSSERKLLTLVELGALSEMNTA
jgi:hypothetical protein